MTFWRDIRSIFLDSEEGVGVPIPCDPQEVDHHYRKFWKDSCIDTIWVAAPYVQIHTWIERYKYGSDRNLLQPLSEMYIRMFDANNTRDESILLPGEEDVHTAIVPVPMHWTRYMLRGYNHMFLLARCVSEKTHIPWITPIHTRYSRRQMRLSRDQRIRNRADCYFISSGCILPERVFLFDDVVTTGATLHACARVLKAHGVKEVHAYTLASNYFL